MNLLQIYSLKTVLESLDDHHAYKALISSLDINCKKTMYKAFRNDLKNEKVEVYVATSNFYKSPKGPFYKRIRDHYDPTLIIPLILTQNNDYDIITLLPFQTIKLEKKSKYHDNVNAVAEEADYSIVIPERPSDLFEIIEFCAREFNINLYYDELPETGPYSLEG